MNKLRYMIYTTIAAIILCAVIPALVPLTGDQVLSPEYRLPYYLGEDYFLYKKYVEAASAYKTIPVIGDSVIWGHYTSDSDTITAQMNRMPRGEEFCNMGIDGIHPAVMYGLVENYCGRLNGKKIIVGINLLWMSSPRHDLTGAKNSEINHRMLLPQFTTIIPAYAPSFEERLSHVIKRNRPFLLWLDHLKLTKFREKSLYRWSMDNPSESMLSFFHPEKRTYEIPAPMDTVKLAAQKADWVIPEKSLQWSYTLKTLKLLKDRGNSVLAIITPFNIHMLTDESAKQHSEIVNEMRDILLQEGITVVVPEIPQRGEFADSSHPTAEGYKTIAKNLLKNRDFNAFIKE